MNTQRLVLAACLALTIPSMGCLDYSETLEMRSDGSGTLTIRQTVDLVVFDQMKMLLSSMGKRRQGFPEFDEASIRGAFDGREGITLRSVDVADREENGGRWRDVTIVIDFTGPDALVIGDLALMVRPFAFETESEDDRLRHRFERRIGISAADVQAVIDRGKEKSQERGDKDPLDLGDEELEGFRSLAGNLVAGRKATFELVMPGEVEETNGKAVEEKIVWSYDLVDLIARSHTIQATSSEPAKDE